MSWLEEINPGEKLLMYSLNKEKSELKALFFFPQE